MVTSLTLRSVKGAPLTHSEVDQNFLNLQTTADAAADAVAGIGGKANASAVGVTTDASHLGTFTGTIIPDNQTVKQALQALETKIEAILSGAAAWDLPDEADGDAIPSPGSGREYLSGGVKKIA